MPGEAWEDSLAHRWGNAPREEVIRITETLTEKTLGGLRIETVTEQTRYVNMLVYGNIGDDCLAYAEVF